jgi:hypothetical protein
MHPHINTILIVINLVLIWYLSKSSMYWYQSHSEGPVSFGLYFATQSLESLVRQTRKDILPTPTLAKMKIMQTMLWTLVFLALVSGIIPMTYCFWSKKLWPWWVARLVYPWQFFCRTYSGGVLELRSVDWTNACTMWCAKLPARLSSDSLYLPWLHLDCSVHRAWMPLRCVRSRT